MMHPVIRWTRSTLSALCLSLVAAGGAVAADAVPTSRAVALVDSGKPGGAFGYNGFDVFEDQRVAARFSVPETGDHHLARVALWLMNNAGDVQKKLRVSVQTDALDDGGTESLPSGRRLHSWVAPVQTLGWVPVQQWFVTSRTDAPRLVAGRSYWIVAESKSPPFVDPVWTFAKSGNMVTTTTYNGAWQTAGNGAALTLRVEAVPVE